MIHIWLRQAFAGFAPAGQVTTQAGLAALSAFVISLISGGALIRLLRRRGVLEDVAKPDSATLERLHSGKRNTPTMGGLMILAATMAAALLWADIRDFHVLLGLALLAALGALGFADDYTKLVRKPRRGMRARTKLACQLAIGLAAGVVLWGHRPATPGGGGVLAPWLGPQGFDLGAWSIGLTALVIAFMSNAVNLTDGVDGLASGCVAMVAFLLSALACLASHAALSGSLGLAYAPEARELAVLCAAVGGATLGFLWYNSHPAQIFMGDTGSLPLGGFLGLVAVVLRQELLMLLVGCVFVAELLSVILQVGWFKLTGRRIFRCSPIHHHFEFAGWPETKVTVRFWIVVAVAAVFSIAMVRVR